MGLQLEAYQDGESVSIGYGHSNLSGGEQFELSDTITEEKAEELLVEDLKEIQRIVNQRMENYGVTFTQGQYDAMVVGTYNRPQKLKSKQIYTILASGDMDAIKKAWDNTISDNDRKNYPGLVNRLEAELNLIDNVEEPTTSYTPEPQDPDRGIPAPSETFVPYSLPVTRRTPQVNQEYYTQVPLAAQNPSYARVKQMLEAQVNKQKKAAGQPPLNTIVPKPNLYDSLKEALKLLGR